ncbi:MAG: RNA polymerase sigma factor, partial [Acidimicrobiales bacterium]
MQRARAGDRQATDDLLRRHYDRLYAVCRRLTGDDGDAADAAQEVLIAIVRGLAGFDGRSRFTTWSYRIAVNASLDELRRRRRRPVPATEDELRAVSRDGADAAAARIDVDRALAAIPVEFRVAVVLRDLCGLDYAEIGQVLDLPPGTVRSRIARGRAALAPLLAADPGGHR